MSATNDLARRAVACQGWRDMPGIRWVLHRNAPFEPVIQRTPDGLRGWTPHPGTLPDLSDPATLGCLEAMAGAAHTDPLLRVEGYPDGWRVYSPAKSRIVGLGPDRAAALVAALETAP
jgi:hypothetical protein